MCYHQWFEKSYLSMYFTTMTQGLYRLCCFSLNSGSFRPYELLNSCRQVCVCVLKKNYINKKYAGKMAEKTQILFTDFMPPDVLNLTTDKIQFPFIWQEKQISTPGQIRPNPLMWLDTTPGPFHNKLSHCLSFWLQHKQHFASHTAAGCECAWEIFFLYFCSI